MKLLDIGELSKRTGLPASTLRYYDEIGLVPSVARRGLRRQFAPEAVLRLTLISMGKEAGFALDDIRRMFVPGGMADVPRADLRGRADAMDRQIRELTVLRNTLRHVADCPAPSHMECPTFRRIIALAGKRAKMAGRKHSGPKGSRS